jgi:hypothetical protein
MRTALIDAFAPFYVMRLLHIISPSTAQEYVVMLRQTIGRHHVWVLTTMVVMVAATIGISAATGKVERSPECEHLARLVAGREHSMLDSQRFRETEQQAYGVCARDPAAFRKLIRTS